MPASKSFNRTIVELKSKITTLTGEKLRSFNRTIVELKSGIAKKVILRSKLLIVP